MEYTIKIKVNEEELLQLYKEEDVDVETAIKLEFGWLYGIESIEFVKKEKEEIEVVNKC